jgi:hypothetical protein
MGKMRVLLVEPDYKSKFPPLGLLKIGTFHKNRGDEVVFVRGLSEPEYWDRVYITTLFSFHHEKIIKTILHYKAMLRDDASRIFVGGGYATLCPQNIYEETGIYPLKGLLDKPNMLGLGEKCVDLMIPDYDLLNQAEYDYGQKNCYFGYATRGCVNRCAFCAVPKLEPEFVSYTGLKKHIETVKEKFGERQNLVLMDNNVLASEEFDRIIGDLIDLNFGRGAKLNGRLRFVDFNQGLETERITKEKAKKLAQICLKPVRLAYDFASDTSRTRFERAVQYLAEEGFTDFSTYVLYNFNDKPSDFYRRLDHCRELNDRLKIQIYSFPMRYLPPTYKDRSYVGKHWNRKMISGLQKITNVTHGSVMPGSNFFRRAYGTSFEEFEAICAMPDNLLLYRGWKDEDNPEAALWRDTFLQLTQMQKNEYWETVSSHPLSIEQIERALKKTRTVPIRDLLTAFQKTPQNK